ncbi:MULTISPECIES: hypothetical protein [Sanguibacter]|uniref:Uncharacterized protein n=1 Tax=Sanguibacter inulinus TaxID=60922 RepID=A0A853EVP4_9MICO|nr:MULTISPECIES: hypothetical protein [Sanguibacter]KQT96198.1 hypothetical protein ASG53_13725 [Sanguibacter sp. Leaf3]MBF0722587.1 hypothetical protein [Sanguibacter inulinus]NYS93732.1 hypothetical protein [Sanguibacter inulinus]
MPTEIVLLSEVEPTSAVMVRAAAVDHPDGTFLEYRDGQIRQFVDAQGRALLSIYRSRPVREPREAADIVMRPPTAFGLWTDMAVPYGDTGAGRALAESIAAAVGGTIADRV